MSTVLDISASILGPSGAIELEDEAGGYTLHDDSFTERSITHRKTDTSGEWVEGTFTVRSVRENSGDTLAVWVEGTTPFELDARVSALLEALSQNAFQITVRFGDFQEVLQCTSPADHTISTNKAYRFATLALVRATLSFLPSTAKSQVTP